MPFTAIDTTTTIRLSDTSSVTTGIDLAVDGVRVYPSSQGNTTLYGGLGNDTYVVHSGNDVIIESAGEGTDTVFSYSSYTLGANVERLYHMGTTTKSSQGNSLDNFMNGGRGVDTLYGLTGNDTLNGGQNVDTLIGGTGDDTYHIDTNADVIIELAGEGIDTVIATNSYTLSAEIEAITFTGSGNYVSYGNDLDNTMQGGSGNDTLRGGLGSDNIWGGAGNDTLDSGALGPDADNGHSSLYGEDGNDSLWGAALSGGGDYLVGGAGDDYLYGDVGDDTMMGGTGNDRYYVDAVGDVLTENASEGTDTVITTISFSLAEHFENLSMTDPAAIVGQGNSTSNYILGSAASNTLYGYEGDDSLDGGALNDTLIGGLGNDIYVVDHANDTVTELNAEGTDTIRSAITFTLSSFVEVLSLTGSSNVHAFGNTLDNSLTGNSGNNTLDGSTGADTMTGGSGNDTYIVDNTGDLVTEAAASGTDTVTASIDYTLTSHVEVLTLTGTTALIGAGNTLANTLVGNTANNTLSGGAGADSLDGGAGTDTLEGGLDNDIFVVDNTGDVVVEAAGEGTDTIQSSISFTLAANVEVLSLTGSTNIDAFGAGDNNNLIGNSGNNTLDGGLGADNLTGGTGNDTYILDNTGDLVTEASGAGTDTVILTGPLSAYTLTTNLEILRGGTSGVQYTLTAQSGNSTLVGNDANDTLNGGGGADSLDGGAGADTMTGAGGNDTYVVDNTGDIVTEATAAGTDTILSSITYTIATNVEHLTLTGSANIDATGNTTANSLTGNTGDNTLDGGAGADTLIGGLGNDTYNVDNTGDVVTETAGQGSDTILASISYTVAANVEALSLTGTSNLNATGRATTAETLLGNAGNNTLDGLSGADSMAGGTGNDTYVVDDSGDLVTENSGEGTDTVQTALSYTLGNHLEVLSLTGSGNVNATGNTLDNTLVGNSGANTLDGGSGADSLAGGTGNDTYIVDNASDIVTEGTSAGTDTILASVDYTLGTNIEHLTLTGSANINATGNTTGNTLMGNAGNNTLDGAGGTDTLIGGLGNDTYVVDASGEVVTEAAGEGTDTILSAISFTLAAHTEVLSLTGTGGINAIGNALDNTLLGNTGANTLDGLAGADNMAGGTGNDTYVIDNTNDVVSENPGEGTDTIQSSITLTITANVETLTLTGSGNIHAYGDTNANTLLGNTGANTLDGLAGADSLAGGGGNDVYVVDNANDIVTEAVSGTDTIVASLTYTIASGVEVLSLTGTSDINAFGDANANTLIGNSGNNTLGGNAGADTMTGGLGNDTYVIDNTGDLVTENTGEGTDTVQSAITYTLTSNVEVLSLTGTGGINAVGNALDNTLVGNTGANTLDGQAGADSLAGGTGNDVYIVDNAGDVLTEAAASGTDTIQSSVTYTLAANVETLSLTGSSNIDAFGTTAADTLVGNTGANTLDGGAGADSMAGGTGNDTYVVDNASDIVTEASGSGTDTIMASISFTLAANTDVLSLTGSANINATGTAASTETLVGNSGDNTLNGLAGAEAMSGGLGNDTYVVDNTGDLVTENSGEGTDTVQSSITYTLTSNVEVLSLTGASAIHGTGNSLDNSLVGNSAANSLTGLAGNDTLNGGTGADTLIGGTGNDVYIVDNASDVVTEALGEGTDTIQSTITFTLTNNTEVLSLMGTNNINGVGNALDNTLFGNTGNNALNGLAGADTMMGGAGDDTYTVDNTADVVTENASEGNDTVTSSVNFSLGAHVEVLTLTGTTTTGHGNALDNTMVMNATGTTIYGYEGNDAISMIAGNTTAYGGIGNDLYLVNNTSNIVIENLGEGTDVIIAMVSHTLAANVEHMTMIGSSVIGMGNTLDNTIVDSSGTNNNTLYGLAGNDVLDGGSGTDTMFGGTGDDTFIVAQTTDVVTELASEGIDTVQSSISYTLTANVEVLSLTGSSNINAVGNAADNSLFGNTGNNILDGGVGSDTLIGGAGNDSYTVDNSNDVVVELASGGTDTIQSSVTYTLSADVERLTLTGGGAIHGYGNTLDNNILGNALNNSIFGYDGNDNLDGGAGIDYIEGGVGDDTLTGGADTDTLFGGDGNDRIDIHSGGSGGATDTAYGGLGNDWFWVGNNTDVVVENAVEGIDTIEISNAMTYTLGANIEVVTLTGAATIAIVGNASDNTMTGNTGVNTFDGGSGNDTLDGGTNIDTLIGGLGDDLFIVDNASDVIIENINEGTDTIQASISYTLTNNVEILSLTGSNNINANGSAANDILIGNSGANFFSGGAGTDTMIGGLGNDVYVVDSINEVITEYSNEGIDTVQIHVGITYTLNANVENLIAFGSLNSNLIGNALNNSITGNWGNNTLDGDIGSDTLRGDLGNDIYIVDNTSDIVIEASAAGIDTILSSISYTLASNVEVLSLTGSANINATGGSSDDTLLGNTGTNSLVGAAGNDTLAGYAGNDVYNFNGIGDGIDWISDSGLSTDVDQVLIGSSGGLIRNNIAIFQNGNNLEIAYVGTSTVTSKLTLTNHFAPGDASRIENITFTGDNFFLSNTSIDTIITNMANYAAANSIALTDIDVVKGNANLMAIVNAGWSP